MKRFYLIVFALLLPLGQVKGQMLNFHAVYSIPEDSMEISCGGSIPQEWGADFDCTVVPSISGLSVLYSYSDPTLVYPNTSFTMINFSIDTTDHTIRKLRLYYRSFSEGLTGDWYHEYTESGAILLDSLPYSGDLDTIINMSFDSCHAISYDSASELFETTGQKCTGEVIDSGIVTFSALDLQFSLHSQLVVANNPSNDIAEISSLRIVSTYNGLIANFSSAEFSRIVTVTNTLGQLCLNVNIPPDLQEISLPPLPHGCYFARMGMQVVKFYVLE